MGKASGFLEYERKDAKALTPEERIKNYDEFHVSLTLDEQQIQASRCMDCGVPFCQYGQSIDGMTSGCPLNNLIPEWNDLLYRGNYKEAYERLKKTSNFPEFTSRVCPALCEKACTCNINGDSVATKENEKTIIEYAYAHGYADARPPVMRTGKRVAVIGSGPAGLAVSDQLNFRGHSVTVFERSDSIGGLLRYGIPNMKLEKSVIDRKLKVMEEEGVVFKCGVNVGKDVSAADLIKEYDAVVLSCGASNPRDIKVEGRDADGIHFAVEFLTSTTKSLMKHGLDKNGNLKSSTYISAKDKNVIVIGGGDTGNDCVGTCLRHGCKSMLQLEMMEEPPVERRATNPWPAWPLIKKTDYGQEESASAFGKDPRVYKTTVQSFKKDKNGKLTGAVLVSLEKKKNEKTGRFDMVPVKGSEKEVPCELVLIAAGFLG
ncbi:MAG: glutamate synthase subunit beta, partial [Lachnospiraceae bacterium]|nr:glutamate synthase subunit beta [Lachnospiraceae bacterium]